MKNSLRQHLDFPLLGKNATWDDSFVAVAEKVFQATSEGVLITDSGPNILWINEAFSRISGYQLKDVKGKNPSVLQSGIQDSTFYESLWKGLKDEGEWQGEIWNRRNDATVFPEWLTIRAIPNERGKPALYVGVFTDITKRKEDEETIHRLSCYDMVTELPNRNLFEDRLKQSLERAEQSRRSVAVILIGLSRFKTVNETLGYRNGDALLKQVAERLLATAREGDTVARIRGDTFCCLLSDLTRAAHITPIADKILGAFSQPFHISGHEIFVLAGVGISVYPLDGKKPSQLLQAAEAAMNQIEKDSAHSVYQFCTPAMTVNKVSRLTRETDLRKAIGGKELQLYYQPKVTTGTGKIVGAEALMRWHHPTEGLISPVDFIPMAEETGLIGRLGEWALRSTCVQLTKWYDEGLPLVPIAVNLSPTQIRQPHFVDSIMEILEDTGVDPSLIELELTESAVMGDAESALTILSLLHDMGLGLSIDDFGTGYSSLALLKRYPIQKLKVDKAFINDLCIDSAGEQLVSTIIDMARGLNLRVVAEGVESQAQRLKLSTMQCDEIQGFLYSAAVPKREFEALLRKGTLDLK